MKKIEVTGVRVGTELVALLASLSELRHENVNIFIGGYIEVQGFSYVFEYCTHKSVQASLVCFEYPVGAFKL